MDVPDWIVITISLCLCSVVALFILSLFPWTITRNRNFRLHGRAILITGAGGGLGKQLAQDIIKTVIDSKETNNEKVSTLKQTQLVLLDISPLLLQQAKTDLEQHFGFERLGKAQIILHTFVCDVGSYETVKVVADEIKERISPANVSVLINNAGIVSGKSFLDLSCAEFERTMKVNAVSHFYLLKQFIQGMSTASKPEARSSEALVVTVSSLMGVLGAARLSDYCSSKWASLGFHESLRLELASNPETRNIHMLAVCPHILDTPMFEGAFQANSILEKLVTFCFPPLKVTDVSARVVSAMTFGEHFLILPIFMRIVPRVLHVLPVPIMDFILGIVGGRSGMNGFKGRKTENSSKKSKSS